MMLIRLDTFHTDVLVSEKGPVDLMAGIPIEADEIEELMNAQPKFQSTNGKKHELFQVGQKPEPAFK